MVRFGYKQSYGGHTIFVKHQDSKIIILIVYVNDIIFFDQHVDDIIITGDDFGEISTLKKKS